MSQRRCSSDSTQQYMSERTAPIHVRAALPTFPPFLMHLDTYCCKVLLRSECYMLGCVLPAPTLVVSNR